MRSEVRGLWDAIGELSQGSALILGSLIATWSFSLGLLVWLQLNPAFWNDRRISVVTVAIDLVIVMVSTIQTRRSTLQASSTVNQLQQAGERDDALLAVLRTLDPRLTGLEDELKRVGAMVEACIARNGAERGEIPK